MTTSKHALTTPIGELCFYRHHGAARAAKVVNLDERTPERLATLEVYMPKGRIEVVTGARLAQALNVRLPKNGEYFRGWPYASDPPEPPESVYAQPTEPKDPGEFKLPLENDEEGKDKAPMNEETTRTQGEGIDATPTEATPTEVTPTDATAAPIETPAPVEAAAPDLTGSGPTAATRIDPNAIDSIVDDKGLNSGTLADEKDADV